MISIADCYFAYFANDLLSLQQDPKQATPSTAHKASFTLFLIRSEQESSAQCYPLFQERSLLNLCNFESMVKRFMSEIT